MEQKHTSGPWYACSAGNDYQGLVYVEKTGENIAVTYDKKNAELIAAAPDLLEALQTMMNITGAAKAAAKHLGAFKGLDVEYHTEKAIQAIQKATA